MEINGLPLHPLAVHAAVVLGPVAALMALAYVVPAWRDRLRWPLLGAAVLCVVSVVVAYLSGNSFRDANNFFNEPASAVTAKIDDHQSYGTILLWVSLGFGILAAAATSVLHQRDGLVRHAAGGVVAAVGLGVLVLTVLTGESGASAVWDGFNG